MKAIRDRQEESAIELLYSLGYGYLGDGRWAKQGNRPPAMPPSSSAAQELSDTATGAAPRSGYGLYGVPPLDDKALAQVVSLQGDPPEDGSALSRWALRLAQAVQAVVLNPRIEATEEATPPSTMAAEEAIVRAASSLIALAQRLGVSFTVTHNPRRPFAMGNYDHVVEAWPARTHRKPVLTHWEG